MIVRTVIVVLIGLSTMRAQATPSWAMSDTLKRTGNELLVVCSGVGPSLDLARSEAFASCKATAAAQVLDSAKVKVMTVETEKDVALHQTVTSEYEVHGAVCDPRQEAIEEDAGRTRAWVQCRFDLGKIKVVAIDDKKSDTSSQSAPPKGIVNSDRLNGSTKDGTPTKGTYVASTTKRLTIIAVPACNDLLIDGERPRIVRCDRNPITLLVRPTDTRVLVRARGFAPKTLEIDGGLPNDASVQIVFQ